MSKAYAEGNLKYGVIGAGLQGEAHVQCVASAANATLVAIEKPEGKSESLRKV